MNAHQVLTGALNDGDFTFSVGCVDGHKFIVSGRAGERLCAYARAAV